MREDLLEGWLPQPVRDPDVVALLAAAQDSHEVLRGPASGRGPTPPIPLELLKQALLAIVPDLIQEVAGDERNSLLTLARILVTLESGQVVSKDAAKLRVQTMNEP